MEIKYKIMEVKEGDAVTQSASKAETFTVAFNDVASDSDPPRSSQSNDQAVCESLTPQKEVNIQQ